MGAIPVSDFKTIHNHPNLNTDIVTPIQYALDKVSVKGSFEHIYQAHIDNFKHDQGRLLSQDLSKGLPDLLKYGIGVDTVKTLSKLSLKDRFFKGKEVGKTLHQEFNELAIQHCPEIVDNQNWTLTLERHYDGIKVVLEPNFYTLTMEPSDLIYHHPFYHVISRFLLLLSEKLGARNEHELLIEAEWELDEHIELINEKAFKTHYSEIVEFYESIEESDDVVNKFNKKWGKIIKLVEECRPELLETQLAFICLPQQQEINIESLLKDFTDDEIESDPILKQLATDITWLNQIQDNNCIHSHDCDDNLAHRLFTFTEQVDDLQPAYITHYEDRINDAWNNGGSFQYTVDISQESWLADLQTFSKLWSMMLRYFQCNFSS